MTVETYSQRRLRLRRLALCITAAQAARAVADQRFAEASVEDDEAFEAAATARVRARDAHENALLEWYRASAAILLSPINASLDDAQTSSPEGDSSHASR